MGLRDYASKDTLKSSLICFEADRPTHIGNRAPCKTCNELVLIFEARSSHVCRDENSIVEWLDLTLYSK